MGKIKRVKQYGRMHIDILLKERVSKALVVVEVKKKEIIWLLLFLKVSRMSSGL